MTWEEWLKQIIKDVSEEYTISEVKSTEMWTVLREKIIGMKG